MARPKSEFRKQLEAADVGQIIETEKTFSSVRQIVGKLNKGGKHFSVFFDGWFVIVRRVV